MNAVLKLESAIAPDSFFQGNQDGIIDQTVGRIETMSREILKHLLKNPDVIELYKTKGILIQIRIEPLNIYNRTKQTETV